MSHPNKPTDTRSFRRQLERELIVGGLIVGTVIGVSLIYLIWGSSAALTALFCFVLFLGLILMVWLFLVFLEWLGKRGD